MINESKRKTIAASIDHDMYEYLQKKAEKNMTNISIELRKIITEKMKSK